MADVAAAASAELGVPVIDGVAAATKLVESLIALGLRTSARDEYAPPGPKRYTGLLRDFTI
jgi:allantoin racemase